MGRHLKYRLGSFYRVDDRTGFSKRAERTQKEWDGAIVDRDRWEPRQPQDFVRGVKDEQGVPDPRPLAPDVFVGPYITTITAGAAAGVRLFGVVSVGPMAIGDAVEIMLANGAYFASVITAIGAGTITFADGLPFAASSGAQLVDVGAAVLSPLLIAGAPATTGTAGVAYSFTPTVTGGVGTLLFAITNKPAWAAFSTTTGKLSGTPAGAEVDAGIIISVTDALGRSAQLTALTITVAAAGTGGEIGFDWSNPNQSIGIFV